MLIYSLIDVNKSLLNLHKISDGNNDPQMCDFIEKEYLEEQVKAIKKLADMVTQLNRVGEGKVHPNSLACVSQSLCYRPWCVPLGPTTL